MLSVDRLVDTSVCNEHTTAAQMLLSLVQRSYMVVSCTNRLAWTTSCAASMSILKILEKGYFPPDAW